MSESMSEICAGRVWDGWHHVACRKAAKKDGFCGIHHPDAKKRREEKANAKYEAKRAKWKADADAYRAGLRAKAIGELVLLKMTSSNDVPVERCTITAAEISALDSN